MTKTVFACVLSITFGRLLSGDVIDTNNPAAVSAFQAGATVVNFESISGITPQSISNYTSGNPVSTTSFIFDQISGVEFSVGGMVGTSQQFTSF